MTDDALTHAVDVVVYWLSDAQYALITSPHLFPPSLILCLPAVTLTWSRKKCKSSSLPLAPVIPRSS